MMKTPLPRLLFTVGDMNGIGPEVLVKALRRTASSLHSSNVSDTFNPVIIGNSRLLREYVSQLSWNDVSVSETEITIAGRKIPLIPIDSDATLELGTNNPRIGKLAGDAIARGVELLLSGEGHGLVTMPISKHALNQGGYNWPGHTEMIAHLSGGAPPLMILLTEGLRVALATIHVPLSAVPTRITPEHLKERFRTFQQTLKIDFGVAHPRIAVLGLNPHAGEEGNIGTEEITHIQPAIADLRAEGCNAEGPFPADGFFARYKAHDYDGVLAMYHDQGLIPLKMFAHGGGVNVTAGLPIVRTSPDHGTAFPIAGQGIADETSVVEAIQCAMQIAQNRMTEDRTIESLQP